jgi:hypothetical protein
VRGAFVLYHDRMDQHSDFAARPDTRAQQDRDDWRAAATHPAVASALRLIRMVLRGVVVFAFCFLEIIAELAAPIVLICGIGWTALPGLLAVVGGSDGQVHDVVSSIAQAIPGQVRLGHTTLTPTTLIVDGLLLIGVVALCRTVQTIVASEA